MAEQVDPQLCVSDKIVDRERSGSHADRGTDQVDEWPLETHAERDVVGYSPYRTDAETRNECKEWVLVCPYQEACLLAGIAHDSRLTSKVALHTKHVDPDHESEQRSQHGRRYEEVEPHESHDRQ